MSFIPACRDVPGSFQRKTHGTKKRAVAATALQLKISKTIRRALTAQRALYYAILSSTKVPPVLVQRIEP